MPPIHIVLKIKRAEEHIDNLNRLILAFKSTNPYEITGYSNPQAGEAVYKISKAAEIPLGISLIVGDVLQNLRTSLDYLAGELVRASGNVPDSNTAFPISSSATDYETEKRRKVKGMRQDIIDAIDAVKPYKGGNDTLWRLHELNRIDKHACCSPLALVSSGSIRAVTRNGFTKTLLPR